MAEPWSTLHALWGARDWRLHGGWNPGSPNQRAIDALLKCVNEQGVCWYSTRKLAALASTSPGQFRRSLKWLELGGCPFIRVHVERDRRSAFGDPEQHRYTLTLLVGWDQWLPTRDQSDPTLGSVDTHRGGVQLIQGGISGDPEEDTEEERSKEDSKGKARRARTPPKARAKSWRRVPDDWQPNDGHRQIAGEEGKVLERELVKFRDHEFPKPKTDADAAFRNWLRNDIGKPGAGKRGKAESQPSLGVVDFDEFEDAANG
jgi:hypothetical protein